MKLRRPQFLLLGLCFLVVLLASTGTTAAQPTATAIQDYEALVRECHAAAQRHDLAGLRAASTRLLAVAQVQLAPDDVVTVDNTWLKEAIEVPRPDTDAVAARLGAQLEILITARDGDPQALQKLRDILSRPPYGPREKSWIEKALGSIGEFLDDLFAPLGRNLGFASLGEALVTVIALIALVAGLVYIARLIRGALVREARSKTSTVTQEHEPETSAAAVSKADEVAAGGDYRTAVRYLYLSTILWLHERRLLHYDRALTNYEVLRSIPLDSPLHSRLKPVVQTFDWVWYGHHELDGAAFEHFRHQVAGLREGQP